MVWDAGSPLRVFVASLAAAVVFALAPAVASASVFSFTELGPPSPYLPPSSDAGKSVVSGDFNRDGHADIAFANSSGFGGTTTCPNLGCVSVLLGHGDDTFTGPVNYGTDSEPYFGTASLAKGDLRGNGVTDLVVATFSDVEILYGNGDGTFQAPVSLSGTGAFPDAVVVADFDGDGRPDIAVANAGSQDVSILLNQGGGVFAPAPGSPFALADGSDGPINGMALANLTGHGKVDLVLSVGPSVFPNPSLGSCNAVSCVQVLTDKGDGSGAFNAAVGYPVASNGQIAAADLRGSGADDVLVPGDGGFQVLLNQGDGVLGAPATFTYPGAEEPQALAVGDFNGDGHVDVAEADFDSSITVLLEGHGDGTFSYDDTVNDPGFQQSTDDALLAASFTGTCKLDLALGSDNGLFILRNDTPYTCPAPPPPPPTTTTPPPSTTTTTPQPPASTTRKSGLKRVTVHGVPRRCTAAPIRLRIVVTNSRPPQVTIVKIDGRRIAHSRQRRFTVHFALSRISPGRHTLTIKATDTTKHSLTIRRRFRSCAPVPRFTG